MNKLTTEHTPDNIIASWLDDHQEELVHTADYIFHHPELAYQETLSSKCLADYLESQGFKITWKTAGIDTSFTAVWGSGKPLLGFLAEYDALAGVGHACGHNLLGTAVAAAACALKCRYGSNRCCRNDPRLRLPGRRDHVRQDRDERSGSL